MDEDATPTPAQASVKTNLPWGMEDAEMQPSSLTSLTDDKLACFALGNQKKTKFQKEREDREAKKRQADEEAAKIYATFVASFDNEDETKGKTFVRSGAHAVQGTGRQSEVEYRLKGKGKGDPSAFSKKVSEMDKMLHEIMQKGEVQVIDRPKKRRAIDDFVEEMKERGPVPVSMEGSGMTKGSFDNGDPETTNLYVGNLAPTITEEVLKMEFGRYGEVYSVKIMWPRSEEERVRRRNCGFVSFYERGDADDARINLDNKQLDGQPMIVGWGKAVTIPARAHARGLSTLSKVPTLSINMTSSKLTPSTDFTEKSAVKIELPSDKEAKWLVDRLARYVATDGLQFENAVRMRETNNKAYSFLFEPHSPLGLYYRWRVYSLVMGDNECSWRVKPFQMTSGGPMWYPPKMPFRSPNSFKRSSPFRSYGRSSRQSRSRSNSRSKARNSSASPERISRRGQSRGRHRSRSSSVSSDGDRKKEKSRRRLCTYRDQSRKCSRRSHSWSSDDSRQRKRNLLSRSRSRSRKNDRRRERKLREISQERRRSDAQIGNRQGHIEKGGQLLTGQQIARARDMEKGRERSRLSSEDYDTLKDLLEELTLERDSVKKVMGFALDNSEAAVDLVNIIFTTFKESTSSGLALVGLLYVTSDILHNSSAAVKNASLFRTTFQECLPEIMDILRIAVKNMVGRMSANAMKERVTNVLTAWENWSLFPPAVLVGLHATFLRRTEEDEYIATRSPSFGGIAEPNLERLRKTCRQSGIIATGGAKELIARLQWLKEFTSPSGHAAVTATKKPDDQSCTQTNVTHTDSRADTSDAVSSELTHLSKERKEATLSEKKLIDEDLDGDPIDGEIILDENLVLYDELGNAALDGELLDGKDCAEKEIAEETIDGEDLDGAPMDEGDLDGQPL